MYSLVFDKIDKFKRHIYVYIAAIKLKYYILQEPIFKKLKDTAQTLLNAEEHSISVLVGKIEEVLEILHLSNGNTPLGALETMLTMCSPGSRYTDITEKAILTHTIDTHIHTTDIDIVIHHMEKPIKDIETKYVTAHKLHEEYVRLYEAAK